MPTLDRSPSPPSAAAPPAPESAPGRPVLFLVVNGARFPCRDGDVIGREGTVAGVVLARAGTVSRRHLLVSLAEEGWRLALTPSARNETHLDGQPMARGVSYPLTPGEHRVVIRGFALELHAAISEPGSAGDDAVSSLSGLERLRREFGGGREDLLHLIADNVADLIAVIDQDGKRVWNNAAYLTCLGYRPEELSRSYSMLEIHPDDLPAVKETFTESMRTGVGRRQEYRMRHRDGHWVYLESQARVVESSAATHNASGEARRYLVLVARDVSARKEAEQKARRRAQRLTERTATLASLTQSSLIQGGELDRCFAAVTEAAVQHFDCERAAVWLFSDDHATLTCQDLFEQSTLDHRRGAVLRAASCGRFFATLRADRCVAVDSAFTDERVRELRLDYLQPGRVSSFLAARLHLGDDTLGMITLERVDLIEHWSLEDQHFAASLADVVLLAIQARRRAEAFQAMEASQRQLAAELAEAAAYVRALLPAPLAGPVESEWRFVPCTELGGDGFGHHWLDDEHLAIYLIDVVGHGVGAALLSISALNILRTGSLPGTDFLQPDRVLHALNRAFQMEMQNNLFFTIWYGVFNRTTRQITYSAAGHPPAVLLGGEKPELLGSNGLMIGADPDANFTASAAAVPPFARLYVFSDGAFEVAYPDGTPWGFDTFVACLGQPPRPDMSELDSLRQRLQEIQGRPELPDDFSILRLTLR